MFTLRVLGVVLLVAGILAPAGALAQQAGEATAAPVLVPARPNSASPAPSPHAADHEGASTFTVDDVMDELIALRSDIQRLQSTLESVLSGSNDQLRRENAQLRGELRRLQTTLAAGGAVSGSALLPMPGGAPQMPPAAEAEPAPLYVRQVDVPGDSVSYDVAKEWGRTPDEASEIGPEVTSLKGMICVVPQGTTQEQLVALGRFLHEKFAKYDNINIDVFDDAAAAKDYADTNTLDPAHRVLSVSKYGKSGRDVILLINNGAIREVAP